MLAVASKQLRALKVIAASVVVLVAAVGWWLVTSAPPPAHVVPPGRTVIVNADLGVRAGALHLNYQFMDEHLGLDCSQMADKLNFAVPCPHLLPTDAKVSGPDCCIFSNPNVPPLFVLESHFEAPAGYPGAEVVPNEKGAHGHLLLIAARMTPRSSALSCAAPQSLGAGPQVLGSPSYWQFCPGSAGGNAHHLILEWENEGIDYSLSLHGDTADNRLAIELMAMNLNYAIPGVNP